MTNDTRIQRNLMNQLTLMLSYVFQRTYTKETENWETFCRLLLLETSDLCQLIETICLHQINL